MVLMWAFFEMAALAGECEAYETASFVMDAEGIDVHESSGLAASRVRPGVYFTHDDSGSGPVIYSFDLEGTVAEAHTVTGGSSLDWEDIATGPCPDSVRNRHAVDACLFIGDIGDNPRVRETIRIHIVSEPIEGSTLPVLETWELEYPGGPRDSEAILVHPATGQLTVVTKTLTGTVEVFALRSPPEGETTELTLVTELSLEDGNATGSLITGADWDADGERLVLRTYGAVYLWVTDPCEADAHWSSEPQRLLPYSERQGEAVCFAHEGGGILTSSEGSPMPVSLIPCSTWHMGDGPCADTEESAGNDSNDGSDTPNPHPGSSLDTDEQKCGGNTSASLMFSMPLLWWRRRNRVRHRRADYVGVEAHTPEPK